MSSLKFAPDVEAILSQHGKVDDRDGWVTLGHIKVDRENETENYERLNRTPEYEARPTRTQIIEEAVRLWHVSASRNMLDAILGIGPLVPGVLPCGPNCVAAEFTTTNAKRESEEMLATDATERLLR